MINLFQSNAKDVLNPINLRITYNLVEEVPPSVIPGAPVPKLNDYPTLNQNKAEQIFPVSLYVCQSCRFSGSIPSCRRMYSCSPLTFVIIKYFFECQYYEMLLKFQRQPVLWSSYQTIQTDPAEVCNSSGRFICCFFQIKFCLLYTSPSPRD